MKTNMTVRDQKKGLRLKREIFIELYESKDVIKEQNVL